MMKSYKPMRMLLSASLIAAAILAMSLPGQAAEKQVNFYAYSDYIDTTAIKEFEKSTGIKVIYDTYADIGSAEAKMLTGATGYDVVNAETNVLDRMIKANLLVKLDKSKLPNWKNLNPVILQQMAGLDPGNTYMVPFFHGVDGIAYNIAKQQKIMKDAPVDSLAMLFEPEILKKFKKCGVNYLDSVADVIGSALIYIGKDPNPKTNADVDAAMEVLWKARPYISTFDNTNHYEALANGEYCLSMAWGGDHLKAQVRADSGKTGVKLAFNLPKEGSLVWYDGFFIPKTAKNLDEAYAFMNALMEPKFAAANSNLNFYPGAIPAAYPMIDKRMIDHKGINLPDEGFAKLKTKLNPPTPQLNAYISKSWNKLKSGKR
ncbi:MAG: extracellular solute-binding protein [Candidatus Symbiobacter sp.]|nr:extracellular solute-binding protein [Candidatus Symbiobacter sp.]